jgi:hypothetical protein
MFRFTIRDVLLLTVAVALFLGLYVHVWRLNHFLPALFTTIAAATLFMEVQIRQKESGKLGAVLGGAAGGILSIALHKVACDILMPDVYEHEGLPLFEFTLLFSPLGAVCGMIVGLFVWALKFLSLPDNCSSPRT